MSPVEWRDQVRCLVSEIGDRPPRRFLTDLRAAGDVSTITDEHITEIAEMFASGVRGAKAKVALIASNLFDSAELFEREPALSGVVTTIVFYDFGTACAWLGVDKDSVHRQTTELRRKIIARGRWIRTRAGSAPGLAHSTTRTFLEQPPRARPEKSAGNRPSGLRFAHPHHQCVLAHQEPQPRRTTSG